MSAAINLADYRQRKLAVVVTVMRYVAEGRDDFVGLLLGLAAPTFHYQLVVEYELDGQSKINDPTLTSLRNARSAIDLARALAKTMGKKFFVRVDYGDDYEALGVRPDERVV